MKPRPSCYNGAILKKLVVFLNRVELLCLQLRCRKVEERLWCLGSFAKAGWKLWLSGNWLQVSSNGLKVASYMYKLTGEKLELFTFRRDAAR